MAHYLTFNSSVTCTVNGSSVSSGYELHDGDVIVASSYYGSGIVFNVNNESCTDGGSIDIYDSNVEVSAVSPGGGGI